MKSNSRQSFGAFVVLASSAISFACVSREFGEKKPAESEAKFISHARSGLPPDTLKNFLAAKMHKRPLTFEVIRVEATGNDERTLLRSFRESYISGGHTLAETGVCGKTSEFASAIEQSLVIWRDAFKKAVDLKMAKVKQEGGADLPLFSVKQVNASSDKTEAPDLVVFVLCNGKLQANLSSLAITNPQLNAILWTGWDVPQSRSWQDIKVTEGTGARYFARHILTHEVGHAFGLADVYTQVGTKLGVTDGHPQRAIMSRTFDMTEPQVDDVAGIADLYKHIVLDEGMGSCPKGWKPTTRTVSSPTGQWNEEHCGVPEDLHGIPDEVFDAACTQAKGTPSDDSGTRICICANTLKRFNPFYDLADRTDLKSPVCP